MDVGDMEVESPQQPVFDGINLQEIQNTNDQLDWEYVMRRQMQLIVPGIYLGPYGAAQKNQLQNLKHAGITHIVCVRQAIEAHLIRENFPEHFKYLTLDIADTPTQQIIPFFSQVRQFICECLESGGAVLVHGGAGISRSAALVIAFLMDMTGCSSQESLKFVQKKRFCIFPNEGFRNQLAEYEPIMKARRMCSGAANSNQRKRPYEEEIAAEIAKESRLN